MGITLEVFEHGHFGERFGIGSVLDVFLKALAFPILIGSLLSLQNSRKKLFQTISQFDIQRAARAEFANAQTWSELANIILQIPRTILASIIGDALWVINPTTGAYELVGSWNADGLIREAGAPPRSVETCSPENLPPNAKAAFEYCSCTNQGREHSYRNHCLPLVLGNRPLAILQLFIPVTAAVQPDQLRRLAETGPDMALAIERFQLWSTLQGDPQDQGAERYQVIRYLHDTVAPDLAYLRLKLDQFALEGQQPDRIISHQELERLAQIANQVYEKLRVSISEIEEEIPVDLPQSVKDFAIEVGQRAGIRVDFQMDGDPVDLPSPVKRQVLYMVREALRNIEKHAQAQTATICIHWQNQSLAIEIEDDGRGFYPEKLSRRGGRYGLKILEECAQEINAGLHILSSPKSGTRITIWLPMDAGFEL